MDTSVMAIRRTVHEGRMDMSRRGLSTKRSTPSPPKLLFQILLPVKLVYYGTMAKEQKYVPPLVTFMVPESPTTGQKQDHTLPLFVPAMLSNNRKTRQTQNDRTVPGSVLLFLLLVSGVYTTERGNTVRLMHTSHSHLVIQLNLRVRPRGK